MISEMFPEGLRVLVFDEDPDYLMILDQHLKNFQYQVTTCNEEGRVMDLLRKDRFDIAIIDVSRSEGDRFRLISEIGSEMKQLPIIIISKDESVDSIINWMRNGACDYLIKPIKPEDLRLIFKHVAKKEQAERCIVAAGEAEHKAEKSSSMGDSNIRNPTKGKRIMYEDDHEANSDGDHPSTSKKRRVVWDKRLHDVFIEAYEYLDKFGKAVPKNILEYMNSKGITGITGITRENVASHLQKYRMNMKKQNEQNEAIKNNSYLITTAQEARIYGGQEVTDFYSGGDVQFPTLQINNTPQPYENLQEEMKPNLTTQLISPLEHRHPADGVPVDVFGKNLVMAHHYHQTSELAYFENTGENEIYNNFLAHNEDEDDEIKSWTSSFSQNPQEVGLFNLQEPIPNCLSTSSEVNPHQMMNCSSRDELEILNMVDQSGGFNFQYNYSINYNWQT